MIGNGSVSLLHKRRWVVSVFAFAFALAIGLLLPADRAEAACSVPNTITNGQVADATAVMGNFNALNNCVNSVVAPSGTPASGNLPVFSGANTITSGNLSGDCTTSGTLAVTCTKTGGTALGPFATGTDAAQLTGTISTSRFNSGTNADASHFLRGDGVWATPSGGGGGSSNPVVDLPAMRPLTDFTQINISGTRSVTEVSTKAITIEQTSPDTTLRIIGVTRAMPSTTSRVAVFVQPNFIPQRYQGLEFGFSDGTKFHTYALVNLNNTSASGNLSLQTWSNSVTRVNSTVIGSTPPVPYFGVGFWIGLRVNATSGKAYWETSSDGVHFSSFAVATMSSGYLGSTGYTTAYVGLFAYNQDAGGSDYPASVTIRAWDENGLSRTF